MNGFGLVCTIFYYRIEDGIGWERICICFKVDVQTDLMMVSGGRYPYTSAIPTESQVCCQQLNSSPGNYSEGTAV